MNNFNVLSIKTLVCVALATLPALLLLGGIDNAANRAVAQAEVQLRIEASAPIQLAQQAGVSGRTVLVD